MFKRKLLFFVNVFVTVKSQGHFNTQAAVAFKSDVRITLKEAMVEVEIVPRGVTQLSASWILLTASA